MSEGTPDPRSGHEPPLPLSPSPEADGAPDRPADALSDLQQMDAFVGRMIMNLEPSALGTLLDGLPAMVGYWDNNGHNQLANKAYLDYLGWTPEAMRGHHASEVLGGELFQRNLPYIRRAQAGEPQTFESEVTTDRGIRYLQISYVPHFVDGEVRGFFSMAIDISERKQVEVSLAAVEGRFRTLFEAAPTCTMLLARDARIVAVNRAGCELLGLPEDQVVGRCMFDLLHPEDRADSSARLERLWNGEVESVRCEKRYIHSSGIPIWTQVAKTLITSESGEELYVLEQSQDITIRRQHEQDLEQLASRDPLTGLLNRRGLFRELERQAALARRYGSDGALLVVDLDHFKFVNDTLGHQTGDDVIMHVSELIRLSVRDTDIVARLGGDEFAVVLPHGGRGAAEGMAASLLETLATDHGLDSVKRLPVTASIGIAQFNGENTAEEVLQAADLAMYEAKEAGRNRISHHVSGTAERPSSERRLAWFARIHEALTTKDLRLLSQPIVDARTGQPALHELLVRLPSASGGLVPPATFLPIAEQFDLIHEIDGWVISQAARLLGRATELGVPLVLTANVSSKSVARVQTLEHAARELSRYRADPSRLVLEITETAAAAQLSHARRFAQQATGLGCRIAVDDFGAGFGSFYYLKNLPIDYVKIDGDFVSGATTNRADAQIVRAIRDLALDLGHEPIAEYCADQATSDWLLAEGIPLQQGFLHAPPLPVEETLEPLLGFSASSTS